MSHREMLLLDFAWRFHGGGIPLEPLRDTMKVYGVCKAERARGPASPAWYDSDWQLVDLPHDSLVQGTPSEAESSAAGFLPRREAWYRRLLRLEPEDRDRRLLIQFDGVATHCTVWVNGHLLRRNFCGYTSFFVDITDVAKFGDDLNLIAVHARPAEPEGWWYEGGGIYRHVWLLKTRRVAVAPWGVWVSPRRGADGAWEAAVETTVDNAALADAPVTVVSEVRDEEGRVQGSSSASGMVPLRGTAVLRNAVRVGSPRLWSLEDPRLYTLRTRVETEGRVVDECTTRFGFRTIRFSPTEGFFLNDAHVKLKGMCAHEDQGGLGVALPDRVREERIRMLKEMGCNAYRCAHNPPAPETLDLCDRLGLLVMDENRWFDSSSEGLSQLESMIRRDRNHPSVIMWSMANEEPLQGSPRGRRLMESMRAFTRKLDPTRPCTLAMHDGVKAREVAEVSDVVGVNYNADIYDELHRLHADKPLVASEVGGALDAEGYIHDASGDDWRAVADKPFMMGMFKWVAFCYRGEARAWPRLFSRSGVIDHAGTPKENYWFYRGMWTDSPFVKILPHWNWEGHEGELIEVRTYARADSIELLLNGRSLGEKPVDPCARMCWRVPYAPGRLSAVAKKDGAPVAEDAVQTTGAPVRLMLSLQTPAVAADGEDTAMVRIAAIDASGCEVPTAGGLVTVTVSGGGRLLAFDNGDPYDHDPPAGPRRRLFMGWGRLMIRSLAAAGPIEVHAAHDGMAGADLVITRAAAARRPYAPRVLGVDCLTALAKMG